jgi:outer membrane biosynthesis protein TonB
MRLFILILLFSTSVFAQSGRRAVPVSTPSPTPTPEAKPSPTLTSRSQVTAEKDEDYRCTDDGTLAHLLDHDQVAGYTPKEVDVKAEITSRPEPGYTREARRVGVQGIVVLKLLLAGDGKIDRIRVVRRVPYGLTENAIFAACGKRLRRLPIRAADLKKA